MIREYCTRAHEHALPSRTRRADTARVLIWGMRGKVLDLGVVGNEECSVCEKRRPFHLQLHYAYAHLNFIIRVVSSKKYWKLCETCGRGFELPTAVAEQSLGRNPIPAFDRSGLWIFGGIILFFVALIALAAILG